LRDAWRVFARLPDADARFRAAGRERPAEGDQRQWRLEVDSEGGGNWSECNKYLKG
jgi:hypothetical protein